VFEKENDRRWIPDSTALRVAPVVRLTGRVVRLSPGPPPIPMTRPRVRPLLLPVQPSRASSRPPPGVPATCVVPLLLPVRPFRASSRPPPGVPATCVVPLLPPVRPFRASSRPPPGVPATCVVPLLPPVRPFRASSRPPPGVPVSRAGPRPPPVQPAASSPCRRMQGPGSSFLNCPSPPWFSLRCSPDVRPDDRLSLRGVL